MRFRTVFFDLDGTLTDPAPGITNSVSYALRSFGITPPPREELYPFIGPPLTQSFRKYYGFDEEKAQAALLKYREYFSVRGLFENEVYPGIPELLDELRAAGCRLIVASAKPEPYVIRILEHFGLADKFDFIGGNTMEETRGEKAQLIGYGFSSCPGACLPAAMVGDRCYDMTGAIEAGVTPIGAAFGYGSEEELREAGAEEIAADVSALRAILFS